MHNVEVFPVTPFSRFDLNYFQKLKFLICATTITASFVPHFIQHKFVKIVSCRRSVYDIYIYIYIYTQFPFVFYTQQNFAVQH